jgi:hypothetical protein
MRFYSQLTIGVKANRQQDRIQVCGKDRDRDILGADRTLRFT